MTSQPNTGGQAALPSDRIDISELSQSDRILIPFSGIGLELVAEFANRSDIPVLRNRGISELVLFFYGAGVLAIGGDVLFGTPGSFNPAYALIGFCLAYLSLCMNRFLSLRGLYHRGRQEVVKRGLRLDVGSDELAWFFALAMRTAIGISYALTVGTVGLQMVFGTAITAMQMEGLARRNAPIVIKHTKIADERITAAGEEARRDAEAVKVARSLTQDLQKQDIANTRDVARLSPKQQARSGLEAKRQTTTSVLSSYEGKVASAEATARGSAATYDALIKQRAETLRKSIEADPEYVAPARDPLSRLAALRELASQDSIIGYGIWLAEMLSVGLELWSIVAAIAQCPTHLATALYCAYLRRSTAARRSLAPDHAASGMRADDPASTAPTIAAVADLIGAAAPDPMPPEPPAVPPKRPRGRPRLLEPLVMTNAAAASNSKGENHD